MNSVKQLNLTRHLKRLPERLFLLGKANICIKKNNNNNVVIDASKQFKRIAV